MDAEGRDLESAEHHNGSIHLEISADHYPYSPQGSSFMSPADASFHVSNPEISAYGSGFACEISRETSSADIDTFIRWHYPRLPSYVHADNAKPCKTSDQSWDPTKESGVVRNNAVYTDLYVRDLVAYVYSFRILCFKCTSQCHIFPKLYSMTLCWFCREAARANAANRYEAYLSIHSFKLRQESQAFAETLKNTSQQC